MCYHEGGGGLIHKLFLVGPDCACKQDGRLIKYIIIELILQARPFQLLRNVCFLSRAHPRAPGAALQVLALAFQDSP